jgi:uracil-DNA glycosylase
MEVKLEKTWKEQLKAEFDKPYFEELTEFVRNEYRNSTVYPPPKFIFRALELCPFPAVKVVIIGQDPYHGTNQANGLCFAVNQGVPIPPSLQNIYKEIKADLGKTMPPSGNLERWAKQGVLLLNATLTVRANSPGSHQNKGWETFTDAIIQTLSDKKEHLVFLLWGAYAQKKGAIVDPVKHLVLKTVHPSPLSAYNGFFGCRHFSQTNVYLSLNGEEPIDW